MGAQRELSSPHPVERDDDEWLGGRGGGETGETSASLKVREKQRREVSNSRRGGNLRPLERSPRAAAP